MNQRDREPEQGEGVGRRAVLGAGLAGLGAAGLSALPGSAAGQTPATPLPASRSGPLDRPYNVILIVTDEEAYHLRPAEGFATPARAELQLQLRGTTFLNHYIGSAM